MAILPSIMSNDLVRALVEQNGLPEAQAREAVAVMLAFYEARLPMSAHQQLCRLAAGDEPGPPVRYNTPGFGILAQSFDNLRGKTP
jgi:hypothetical protein